MFSFGSSAALRRGCTRAHRNWALRMPKFVVVADEGFAASLDYSKAYDSMSSEASADLFEASGWPWGLCQVIRLVWGCQHRYVCWQGHVHPVPLRDAACVPQGCPFGPVALSAWMASGLARVRLVPG